jgi:hypothetical protein
MKKITELQKRNELGEGRDFGIGFSILNKIGKVFETYLPFTACRDYLNDFIFVEDCGKEIGEAYGYTHKLLNCFKKKRFFFLGVNTLHKNKDNGLWDKKEEAELILINNYKNLESFINKIELDLGLKSKTTIELDEDTLIFRIPIYWSKKTPLISVYTLLIRCFFNIKNDFVVTEDNLKNHKTFIQDDTYFSASCAKFYQNIGKVKYDKFDYKDYDVVYTKWSTVHNFGIQGFLKTII